MNARIFFRFRPRGGATRSALPFTGCAEVRRTAGPPGIYDIEWLKRMSIDCRAVGISARPKPAIALDDVPRKPRGRDRWDGFLRRPDRPISIALRVVRDRSRTRGGGGSPHPVNTPRSAGGRLRCRRVDDREAQAHFCGPPVDPQLTGAREATGVDCDEVDREHGGEPRSLEL